MIRLLWLALSCLVASMASGQPQLDSLRTLLSQSQLQADGRENYHLYDIALAFYRLGLYDSAVYYHERQLANKPNNAVRASALNGIGVAYIAMGRTDKSIGYLTSAIALYDQLNDSANAVTNLANLAIIYKDMGLYDKALESSFQVISRLENQKPDRVLASCYNTVGTVYMNTLDFDKSYQYYRKALLVRQQAGLESGVGQSYNNLGELFIRSGRLDSALYNLHRAAEIKRKLGDNKSLAKTQTNIGKVLVRLNRLSDAEQQFNQAWAMQATINDMLGRIETLNALADLEVKRRNWTKAANYLSQARETIDVTHTPEQLMNTVELQTAVYKGMNDLSKLTGTLEELLFIRDSLHSIEKEKILLNMEAQYETDKKLQQIAFLQSEVRVHEAEDEKQWMAIVSLGLLVALACTVAVTTWTRRRQAELHTREMHHRIKNNLQLLTSMLTIQSDMTMDENTAQMIRSTEGRVNAMALIHKKLYRSENARDIGLKSYISELIQYLVYSYGFAQRELVLKMHVDEMAVDVDRSIVIGLVVNELVSNAFKHALGGQDNPELTVSLQKRSQQIEVIIADNGTKSLTSDEFGKSNSFGLMMIKKLIKDLKGSIALDSQVGTAYTIIIPV